MHLTGTVFGDANSNAQSDSGEGVAGLELRLSDYPRDRSFTVTTGADGRFTIDVPRATYHLTGSHGGWYVINRAVAVGPADTNIAVRAVHPLGHDLTADLDFAQDSYAPGDTVHVTVTLTNTGSTTLIGIGAECAHVGDPNELHNSGPEWGPLAFDGGGATVPANGTYTFEVAATLPSAAQRLGGVSVACDFGYPGVYAGTRPQADDRADVPGQFGTMDDYAQYYPDGHGHPAVGVANVRLVLVNTSRCPVLKFTATTDASGHFRITHIPAGPFYELYAFPPEGWKVLFQNPTNVYIVGNDVDHTGVELAHGSATPPTIPTTCDSGTTTPPSVPSSPPLAETGASTSGWTGAGIAACLVGAFLLLLSRRRHDHRGSWS